ncbi:MAG: hypothetical protein PUK18_06090 [Firmicutes bacterium]|nr:hypothetical protein [Bacillota bacterium]MDY6160762.1 hypothetical protein [Candidatus Faecousia sp.]
MSERYSRLFSLPTNLYTEGSPVLIAAGALLKDNQTGKVLAQLKFRNISQKAIQSVKVKVNACDTAGCPLAGMDSFSYLDLSVAAGEEFGQSKPIYLPDATTRAFSVEILSVVFADHEVFTPAAVSIAKEAPKEVIEEVQRAEAEKEAIEAAQERARKEKIINKRSRWMMVIGFISLASVLLSFIWLYNSSALPFRLVIRRYSVRYLLALVIPCLCLFAAFAGKKKKAVTKTVFLICLVLFILQIASIIGYTVLANTATASEASRNLAGTISRYVNGADFGFHLQYLLKALSRGRVRILTQTLAQIAPSFFAVLPNILCTAVLAVSSKKIK